MEDTKWRFSTESKKKKIINVYIFDNKLKGNEKKKKKKYLFLHIFICINE